MDPHVLERLVRDVLRDHLDCDVVHVGRSGDGGIDLLIVDADRPRAVQVKRRSRNRAESVSQIREFLGALLLGGHMKGIFVTTAPAFSRDSIRAADAARRLALVSEIELVDGGALQEIIRASTTLSEPWERVAPTLASPRPPSYG
ncbi:restriction endonuclease [Antiquaquibacter oligotrophicus]|nr:restriction endonuclease [Antiquaquibacter oligotrophicus]